MFERIRHRHRAAGLDPRILPASRRWKGGGSGTNTVTQQSGPPPDVLAAYNNVVGRAQSAAGAPLNQYTGPMVAGFTPQQMQGFQTVQDSQGVWKPYLNSASQLVSAGTAPITPAKFSAGAVDKFMSPYTNDVVDTTLANFDHDTALQNNQLVGSAIGSGAFGGDRAGVASAEALRGRDLARGQLEAGMRQQGFNTALGEFNTQQQAGTSAQQASDWLAQNGAYAMSGLGREAQNAGLTDASSLMSAGAQQQGLAQAQLNIPYEMFLQQQGYPFQTTNFLAGITEGTGGLSGGQSSTTSPGPSTASQLGGLGLAGLAGVGILGALARGGRAGYADGGATAGFAPSDVPAYPSGAGMTDDQRDRYVRALSSDVGEGARAAIERRFGPELADRLFRSVPDYERIGYERARAGRGGYAGGGQAGFGPSDIPVILDFVPDATRPGAHGGGPPAPPRALEDNSGAQNLDMLMRMGPLLDRAKAGGAGAAGGDPGIPVPPQVLAGKPPVPGMTDPALGAADLMPGAMPGVDGAVSAAAAPAIGDAFAAAAPELGDALLEALPFVLAAKRGGRVGYAEGGFAAPILSSGRGIAIPQLDTSHVGAASAGFTPPPAPIGTNNASSAHGGAGVDINPTFTWSPPSAAQIAGMGSQPVPPPAPAGSGAGAPGTLGPNGNLVVGPNGRVFQMPAIPQTGDMQFALSGTSGVQPVPQFGPDGSVAAWTITSGPNTATFTPGGQMIQGFQPAASSTGWRGGRFPNHEDHSEGGMVAPRFSFSGFDIGGGVTQQAGLAGSGFSSGNPTTDSRLAGLLHLPIEQLQEMAVRFPPETAQGRLVQHALQAKRMNIVQPQAQQPQAGMMGPQAPQGPAPQPPQAQPVQQPGFGGPFGGQGYEEGGEVDPYDILTAPVDDSASPLLEPAGGYGGLTALPERGVPSTRAADRAGTLERLGDHRAENPLVTRARAARAEAPREERAALSPEEPPRPVDMKELLGPPRATMDGTQPKYRRPLGSDPGGDVGLIPSAAAAPPQAGDRWPGHPPEPEPGLVPPQGPGTGEPFPDEVQQRGPGKGEPFVDEVQQRRAAPRADHSLRGNAPSGLNPTGGVGAAAQAPSVPTEKPIPTTPGGDDGGLGAPQAGTHAAAPQAGEQQTAEAGMTQPKGKDDRSTISKVMSSPWLSVLAAGLGMMSSRSPHALSAIGEGGLAGVKMLGAQQESEMAARRLSQEAERHRDEIAQRREAAQERAAAENRRTTEYAQSRRDVAETTAQSRTDAAQLRADAQRFAAQQAAAVRSAAVEVAKINANMGRYQWQPGSNVDPDSGETVTGMWRLPTRGDEEPTFHAGASLTGKATGNQAMTTQLVQQLIHDGVATDTQSALAIIKDPAGAKGQQVQQAKERLAVEMSKNDVGAISDPTATINKWRKYYGLGETPGAAPAAGAKPTAAAPAAAKPAAAAVPTWQHSASGPGGAKVYSNDGKNWFNADGTPYNKP